tara:strand:- start:394 stop:795 length:402 start_codon:yes stop_codon:yes gene_type:complete
MIQNELGIEELTGISALLVHAAKIDDKYTENEKVLILKFLENFSQDKEKNKKILSDAVELEKNSNQLLDFTNIVKKSSLERKKVIVKELWKIILSDSDTDAFESNLMRRISGLIYLPDKINGEIKLQVIQENK